MRAMKQKVVDGMKQGVMKVVGDVAMKVGDSAVEGRCWGFVYEIEVPKALLKNRPCKK